MPKIRIADFIPKHQVKIDAKRHLMAQQVYQLEDIENIKITHREPQGINDKLALKWVGAVRWFLNLSTGKDPEKRTEDQWLTRVCLMETLGPVPSMTMSLGKHMKSVFSMRVDRAMIHTLLEESESERAHLFLFMQLKKPGFFFKLTVATKQFLFFNVFFLAYLFNQKLCYRFSGYLEEEAVFNYTLLLRQLDSGNLPKLKNMKAPEKAIDYYNLPEDATFKDMVLCVRADEAMHREFNHYFAELSSRDDADELDIANTNVETRNVTSQENPQGS
ncbi:alternative oxidase [Stylonychia lemnae]|uniref:Alternative oxidase n=1 Tax=Stylonychia lemnae TaxID=5949 RepID=A0A077ZU97_STYLE|nr:alternative oxidase [Stylonychia lemnae]|eukprot:CDW73447.1 alternative oxidase [Stylonychia lemnae]